MTRIFWSATLAGTVLAALQVGFAPPSSAVELKVLGEQTAKGFGHPESVAYDPKGKVLYVSDFGPDLKPAEKDGKGKISKVSLDGKIIEAAFLPAEGQVLNKPKGIWIQGNRMWVTDIDAVWVFDLKTKAGRKLEIPGIKFANDPALVGKSLFVSDNRADQLFRIEPADFLNLKGEPKITKVFEGKSIFPNGVYPGKGGSLLMAGMESKDKPQALYRLSPGKEPVALSDKIGQLDGLYQMASGDLLATDWSSGSLFQWNKEMGVHKLATGFKGPADLCVIPGKRGLTVVVPDLVAGELRFVEIGR